MHHQLLKNKPAALEGLEFFFLLSVDIYDTHSALELGFIAKSISRRSLALFHRLLAFQFNPLPALPRYVHRHERKSLVASKPRRHVFHWVSVTEPPAAHAAVSLMQSSIRSACHLFFSRKTSSFTHVTYLTPIFVVITCLRSTFSIHHLSTPYPVQHDVPLPPLSTQGYHSEMIHRI